MNNVSMANGVPATGGRGAPGCGAPLYRQIASALWEQIQSGELEPGQQMPSETSLCKSFGVNRLTVRQAVIELQRIGAAEIRRGIGTFVSAPPDLVEVITTVPLREQRSDSTHDALTAAMNPTPTTPLRRVDERIEAVAAASGALGLVASEHLGIPVDDLVRLDTIMMRNGRPWIANSYWFERSLDDVVDHTRHLGLVVSAFSDGLGIDLHYRWRAFSAIAADYDDSAMLGVPSGTALLVRDGVSTRDDDRPVFYVRRRMRGDTAKFVLRYEGVS
jgi:DNA-binding GntR family transcriptional regulator